MDEYENEVEETIEDETETEAGQIDWFGKNDINFW